MKKKIIVGVLYGGKSVEHEVSVMSATNVVASLDPKKYEVVLLPIDKSGKWHLAPGKTPLLPQEIESSPQAALLAPSSAGELTLATAKKLPKKIDVIFPVLHGTNGEDGTVQGLLKLAGIPFVGPGVLASAVGMDKEFTKRLWKEAGLPVGKFRVLKKSERALYRNIAKELGRIVFVKPANAGSSVGVSKVRSEREFARALKLAFHYDSKVLVEEYIEGREIECAVLGNERVRVSVPGEIIPRHEFYSYEAKYLDEKGACLEIPARLTSRQKKAVQLLAKQAFETIGTEGMARVDFFLRRKDGKFFLNEINTLPGFTAISMFPKLFEASGLSYRELIDSLITLALERFARESALETSSARFLR